MKEFKQEGDTLSDRYDTDTQRLALVATILDA